MAKEIKYVEVKKKINIIVLTTIFVFISIVFFLQPVIRHREIFADPLIVPCELILVNKKEAFYKYFVNNKMYIYQADIEYKKIRQIRVICQKSNPENAIVFSIAGFYFNHENTINIFFYIVFVAVYIVTIQTRNTSEDIGQIEKW